MLSLDEFIKKYIGKTVGYPDGQYVGECLSSVKLFIKECFGISPPASGSGSAYGYWSNFPSPLGTIFEKIANDPGVVPVPGDIVIWNTNAGGGYGHISICTIASADSAKFTSWDQNWGGKEFHEVSHYYTNVVGWLHPKGVNTSDNQELDKLRKQVTDLQAEVAEKNKHIGNYVEQVDGFVSETKKLKADHEAEIVTLNKKIDLFQLFKEDLAIRLGSPYTAEDDSIRSGIDSVVELKDQIARKDEELGDCEDKSNEFARLNKSWADTLSLECLTTVATPAGVKRGLASFLKANQANPSLDTYSTSDLLLNILRRIKWLKK